MICRFFRSRRIKDRHLGEHREHPAVLFGLGTVRPRIISADNYQPTGDTQIGCAQKSVRCDIKSDLFHDRGGPHAGHGRSEG